ncbi:MAG: DUF2179 domain-containing protein [Chloroflexi bacterium]|nr:DUF2179 domain-containing protein [Chloroflexota bacterium]
MELEALAVAGGIFALRVIGNIITTMRLVLIVRGEKLWSSVIGTIEALIFALALGGVVSSLDNLWNLAAYSVGYGVGGYLGLVLEQRLVTRFVSVNIISQHHGHDIAVAVREAGYGATEGSGKGGAGEVGSVTVVVRHRQVNDVVRVAHRIDPNAFVTMEELRGIARGHFRRLARPER